MKLVFSHSVFTSRRLSLGVQVCELEARRVDQSLNQMSDDSVTSAASLPPGAGHIGNFPSVCELAKTCLQINLQHNTN